jgi:hypothetical protein
MGQVTIYLDNEIENKLKAAARASQKSVSKWVAAVIKEKVSTQWSPDIVNSAGSWSDDFPSLEEIREMQGPDSRREEF